MKLDFACAGGGGGGGGGRKMSHLGKKNGKFGEFMKKFAIICQERSF